MMWQLHVIFHKNVGDKWKPLRHSLSMKWKDPGVQLKLPPLFAVGQIKQIDLTGAISRYDGLRPLPPPSLCLSVADSGQHSSECLSRGRLSRIAKTQEAEGSGQMGTGQLQFGILVQPAPRGTRLQDQLRTASPTAASSAPHDPTAPRRRPPRERRPHRKEPEIAAETEATEDGRQPLGKQASFVGERGTGAGCPGAAPNGSPYVSEAVRRMFPPKYVGGGGGQFGGGGWDGERVEEDAAAERHLSGAAGVHLQEVAAHEAAAPEDALQKANAASDCFSPWLRQFCPRLQQDELIITAPPSSPVVGRRNTGSS